MRLITDYPQYYDAIFDGAGPVFHRMAFGRGGLAKREQFALFRKLELATPPHGTVKELGAQHPGPCVWGTSLGPWWAEEIQLIVYEDEYAHAGGGKKRMPLRRALEECPDAWASLYIPPAERAVGYRHVRIGRIGVWLRQEGGEGEWRSNQRDRESVLACRRHEDSLAVPRAMWAIDFIPSPSGLLAVDFNTAPELATLGETRAVEAAQILEELTFAARQMPGSLEQF
jgi:hypothetical protein